SKDGQIPAFFSKMNRFGVPKIGLLVSVIAPLAVLTFVHDMLSLANLYAIGFVGAIATNLGSTSTDRTLSLKRYERIFMFVTFILMAAIETTLFIEKPHARMFVITVIALGLLLRGLAKEQGEKHDAVDLTFQTDSMVRLSKEAMITQGGVRSKQILNVPHELQTEVFTPEHIGAGAILCAVTHVGKSLEFALQWSRMSNQKLYVLFIREQRTIIQQDEDFYWLDDQQACETFEYALTFFKEPSFTYLYTVSDLPAVNIVEYAKSLNVSNVILGMSRRSQFWQLVRGDVVTQVFKSLPPKIDLIIIS
ncbi:MAG: amino acid permease, partial [Parachlamydiaceae bacterium]|nr:amino acid permease [Parachlamydiaceae bacterium]